MKTFFKAIGIIITAIVALVVIAAIVIPLLVDPNDFKQEIALKVEQETGRELKIEGDIQLSVFPWLGFELGRVELGNPRGFEAPLFAASEKVAIRIKLMPLLKREVVMDTLTIHGLELNLEKNAEGATNWADLAQAKDKPAAPREPGDGTRLAAFAIGGLDVRDADISWRDATTGRRFQVRNFALTTGALTPAKPVDVELGFDVESAEPPISGRVEGSGTLRADAGAQTLSVPDLRLSAFNVDLSGTLDARAAGDGVQYSGRVSVDEFSPRKLLEQLGQPAIETADAGVLDKASLEAQFSGSDKSVTLKPVTIRLDDSTLEGEASVRNFARPAVGFDLALDQMDADRYLPPPKEGEAAAAPSPGAAASSAGGLPLKTLRALDLDGKLAAGRLKVAKLSVSDFNAAITAKNGLIRVSPASARLYQGSYQGNIRLDARQDELKISLDEKLSGIQAGPLLEDLQGEAKLTGKGDVSIDVTALGTEPERVKETLNGKAAFIFRDGAVKGVNIARMIREARARLKGERLPPGDEPEQTDFAELSGSVTFTNGLAKNTDLEAKSPLLRVNGAGEANLPTEKIDYRVQATVVGTSKGQGGKELAELSGIPIPIRVTGTFTEPRYGLDAEALGKALAESKAKEIIRDKLGGGAETKPGSGDLEDKAKELLKGLLGN